VIGGDMLEALPQAQLVHAMPGRSRLRIPERRGDPVFFASLASGLSTLQGVKKVDVSPLTGSILIHHDVPFEGLAKAAEDVRLFGLATVTAGTPLSAAAIAALPLDVRMIAALGFGALALLQIGRGNVLPQAATLAWYAATLTGWLSKEIATDDGAMAHDAGGDGGE
jgi:hypothetical protein